MNSNIISLRHESKISFSRYVAICSTTFYKHVCAVVHLKGDKEKIMMAWSIGCSGGENRSDIVFNGIFFGRIKYPVGSCVGRINSKMGRILSGIRPLF